MNPDTPGWEAGIITPGAELGQSQEPGTPTQLSHVGGKHMNMSRLPLLFQAHEQGAGCEVEKGGTPTRV